MSTWNGEKSVWPEGKWPTLGGQSPLPPDPPPVASSRGLSATEPGEAGAATEEGDPAHGLGGRGVLATTCYMGGWGKTTCSGGGGVSDCWILGREVEMSHL